MRRRHETLLIPVAVAIAVVIGSVIGTADGAAAPVTTAAAASAPGTYVALPAHRIVDTRKALGGSAIPARGATSVHVTGAAGVPTAVAAVTLAVTVIGGQSGVLTAYPAGANRPGTSNLNFRRSIPVSSEVIVAPGAGGEVTFASTSSAATQLLVDVRGYYNPGAASTPGAFVPIYPTRIADTRSSMGTTTPVAMGTTSLQVAGLNNVAANASAVVLNVTEVGSRASGYLSAFPHGAPRPPTSTLNFAAGVTVANLAVVEVGTGGSIDLYNHSAGATPLVVDVLGYYTGGTPNVPGAFVPRSPTRVYNGRIVGRDDVTIDPADTYIKADNAAAWAANLTVSRQTTTSFATADPNAITPPNPNTSTVNYQTGVPIASAASLRDSGFTVFNRAGSVTAAVDVSGYFLADYVTPGRGGIAGTVTYADGAPYAGLVEIFAPPPYTGDTFAVEYTYSDSAGDYRALDLAPANYVVCVGSGELGGAAGECYQDQQWPCGDACAPPTTSTQVPVTAAAETRVDMTITRS